MHTMHTSRVEVLICCGEQEGLIGKKKHILESERIVDRVLLLVRAPDAHGAVNGRARLRIIVEGGDWGMIRKYLKKLLT